MSDSLILWLREHCSDIRGDVAADRIEQLQAKVAELEAEVERLSAAHVKACQANADSQAELAKAEQRVTEAICELLESQHTWLTKEAVSALIRRKFVKEM